MTKQVHQTICASLGLSLAAGLFQSWLHFQRGVDLYRLASFRSWFLVFDFIALITASLLLTYYYRKNYRATFWAGWVATLLSFVTLLYLILATLYPLLGQYARVAVLLGVVANLVYGTTLAASHSGSRPWLKGTGIAMALLYSAQLAVLLWFIDIPPYPPTAKLDIIQQWLSFADRIVPVLFLFNFVDELKNTPDGKEPVDLPAGLLLAKGMVVILAISTTVLAIQLIGDNHNYIHISARETALAQPFEEGSYVSRQGDTLLYRLLKPLHYDARKRYPLVVGLPFSCRLDNIRQIDACPIAKWLATDENRRKYPCFVFVPRCPPYSGWGGVANTPSVAPLAIEALVSLDKTFSIDARRRYVSGVSRGGYGCWHLIGTHPELFAAAIPVCGEGDPSQAPGMAGISVWAFHGAKDLNVPVRGSREMVSALKKAGGAPRYTEYAHLAHSVWEEVIQTPGLLDWLFSQKRTDHSKATKS